MKKVLLIVIGGCLQFATPAFVVAVGRAKFQGWFGAGPHHPLAGYSRMQDGLSREDAPGSSGQTRALSNMS